MYVCLFALAGKCMQIVHVHALSRLCATRRVALGDTAVTPVSSLDSLSLSLSLSPPLLSHSLSLALSRSLLLSFSLSLARARSRSLSRALSPNPHPPSLSLHLSFSLYICICHMRARSISLLSLSPLSRPLSPPFSLVLFIPRASALSLSSLASLLSLSLWGSQS